MADTKRTRKMRLKKELSKTKPARISFILGLLAILIISSANVAAQASGGSETPKISETSGNADQNLKGIARVNPSTLAMEMSLPLVTYPGRNANTLPVNFSYSSKLWRMEAGVTWWYPHQYSGVKMYVTDITAMFSERASSGWTSNLMPPRIDETLDLYNQNGKPFNFTQDYLSLHDSYEENLTSLVDRGSQNLFEFCGNGCISETRQCIYNNGTPVLCDEWKCVGYTSQICPTRFPGTPTDNQSPTYDKMRYVKRVRVAMPDGSTSEFRKSDAVFGYCAGENNPNNESNCEQDGEDRTGTFLAVDGSGMKLIRPQVTASDQRTFLYLPDGSRYIFPPNPQSIQGHYASEYVDVDGNKTTFSQVTQDEVTKLKWTDTMRREIVDPMPHNWNNQKLSIGTFDVNLPGLDNQDRNFKMKWLPLKPEGCETSTTSNCGAAQDGTVPGALETQSEKLYYTTPKVCNGNLTTILTAGEILFPATEEGLRACNSILGADVNGSPTAVPVRFNPVVLAEVTMPNGKGYKFKYNRYGEITRIDYPSGSYEKFRYDAIPTTSGTFAPLFNQTNRGVVEQWVYSSSDTLEQHWQYSAAIVGGQPPYNTGGHYKITTIASRKDNPNQEGIKTERYLILSPDPPPSDLYGNYGFDDPRAGMPEEEIIRDELGNIRSRTLNEFIVAQPRAGGGASAIYDSRATRDARVRRSVSIIIEGNKALAVLNESEYDENGSAEFEHFSHLNVKRKKAYHYKALDLNTALTGSLETIVGIFHGAADLAAVSEIDYQYNENYRALGILSLPTDIRVLNPENTNEVLAKMQTVFDESAYLVADSGSLTGNLTSTWINPVNDETIPAASRGLRGKPTTTKTWHKETSSWIQTHTQYDQYGNVRKVWDISGDASRYVETQYLSDYGYAYPTTIIMPAPDPTDTHGANQPTQTTTSYDFTTGLPLIVTDEFGQKTKTEYNDSLLRQTKVSGMDNFIIPIIETIYDDTNLTLKVRKQVDENNWMEVTTYADKLGRTIKTRSKDSQGDVVVRMKYDKVGHVIEASNPYRVDSSGNPTETVYWSKTSYDEFGRAVQSFAPAIEGNTGESLGTTEYDFATAGDSIGTVVTTIDPAGRKRRTITNALEQLIRVDEPSSSNILETLPTPSVTPTPSPEPSPTPQCVINCPQNLTNEYPSHSTYYKYDAFGKMIVVTQGVQKRYFLYDSFGRLLRVRQPEQEVNDSLDTQQSVDNNNQWTTGFVYDIFGNIKRATDANGVNIIYEYDKANRLIKRCYTKPNFTTTATECNQLSASDLNIDTPAVENFYDGKGLTQTQSPNYAKGKLTKITSSVSETRYTLFDNLGRILQSEQRTPSGAETLANTTARISKYEYNLSGALLQQTYPSGRTVRNTFESDTDLSQIQSRVASTVPFKTYAGDFSYHPSGSVSQLKLGNGRWETIKFNERHQLTELALGTASTDTSLWKLNYEYVELNSNNIPVNAGNITKQTVSFSGLAQPFVQVYKYDSLQRLTEARETNNGNQTWKQQFNYDRFGNRTGFSQDVNGQVLQINNLTHPTINPLTNRFYHNQGYIYDKNGNLTIDAQNRQFSFNGDNKQQEVRDANGNPIGTYFYDGNGNRVKKVTNLETTIFVYDAMGKLIAEYSTQSAQNPTTLYTTQDHLNSPRIITGATGNIISRRDFMPFGEELDTDANYRTSNLKYGAGDNIRQKFTGYQKDAETQLDFAEARYYNNQHGRFTAVDPLLSSGMSGNPQTFNRYIYVGNNPINITDPTGEKWAVRYYVEKGKDMVSFDWYDEKLSEEQVRLGYIPYDTTYNRFYVSENYVWYLARSREDATLVTKEQVDFVNGKGTFDRLFNLSPSEYTEADKKMMLDTVLYANDEIRLRGMREKGKMIAGALTARAGIATRTINPSRLAPLPQGNPAPVTPSVQSLRAVLFRFTNDISLNKAKRYSKTDISTPIEYVEIEGKFYIVNGNHRVSAALISGKGAVNAQKVGFPTEFFKNAEEVLAESAKFHGTVLRKIGQVRRGRGGR
jgi:RHS repeat-associated protein